MDSYPSVENGTVFTINIFVIIPTNFKIFITNKTCETETSFLVLRARLSPLPSRRRFYGDTRALNVVEELLKVSKCR